MGGWGNGGGIAEAGGIEGVDADFVGSALSGNIEVVEGEAETGGVAGADDDFVGGADAGVGGGEESFVGDGLAVGGDSYPGGLGGADDEGKCGRRFWFGDLSRGLRDGRFEIGSGGVGCGRRCGGSGRRGWKRG